MPTTFDTLIIGGGASGLMAACALARGGHRAAILERQPRVGRKLLSTGNGRCNLTNRRATAADYHGARQAVQYALKRFPPSAVEAAFDALGIPCDADPEGRVYPASRQAASVLDALRLFCDENGVDTLTDFDVVTLKRIPRGYEAVAADGRRVQGRTALVCCGGLAAPKLGATGDGCRLLEAFGHRINPRFPAIAPLKTPTEPIRGLKGIRAEGSVTLLDGDAPVRTEIGEILFTDTGVSGIAAMQLARQANALLRAGRPCRVRLNLLPESCSLQRRAQSIPRRPMEDFLNGIVARRLGQTLVRAAGLDPARPASALTPAELCRLEQTLAGWTLPVTATAGFDQAQVTAGGASLRDFDARTLQSLRASGLYAAGETLDVDGDCGGYNLQWAWASALLAADSISKSLRPQ